MNPFNSYLDLSLQQIPHGDENTTNAYYHQEDVLALSNLDPSREWTLKPAHAQNTDIIKRPFLPKSLRNGSQANEFQFDPPTGRLHGAAPDKNLFKDPLNSTSLNQNVKKMLDFGWKFDPIQCSAASALTHPNSTEALTKEEFRWIKGLKVSRVNEETLVTQAEAAQAKDQIAREMYKTSGDDDELLDDATFKKLLDEFYDGVGTGPICAINKGYNDNDISMSSDSGNPPPTEHFFGTDKHVLGSSTLSGSNVKGKFSDELTKKLPTAPTFPIEEVSQSDRLYMQYLYSGVCSKFTGTEEYNLDLPFDREDSAALDPNESYKKNELPVNVRVRDTYDKKLHNAIEHETVTMREIIDDNPDDYDPAEYWPNMSPKISQSRQGAYYPLARKGQTSTNSPDRSAAVGNQLLTDLQASAKTSAYGSDFQVSSSPSQVAPTLRHGGNALPTTTHVNLLPEYDSDSEAEDSNNSRQVTPTPSSNRAATRRGRHVSKISAHPQIVPATNRCMTTLSFPPPIVRPCTPVHMNLSPFEDLHDASASIHPGQPTSSQVLGWQSTAGATTPTRPLMSMLTPGSASPVPQRRLPKSSFRGHVLATPTKPILLPTSPCPWLVPPNTGPQPPVAHMYPGQYSTIADMYPERYQRMAPRNIKRKATGKKVATKGKNNAGKQKRSAAGEQNTQAGPAPKKRRTNKSAAVGAGSI